MISQDLCDRGDYFREVQFHNSKRNDGQPLHQALAPLGPKKNLPLTVVNCKQCVCV